VNQHSVIVFYDSDFPYAGERPDEAVLNRFQHVKRINAAGLEEALNESGAATLINLHGPYFPKTAWQSILGHLRRGGGLVHAGGAPFRIPVNHTDGRWEPELPQTAYHQALGIHEALEVRAPKAVKLAAASEIPLLQGRESLFGVTDTYGLVLHVTHASDLPQELGSGGPMDAHIYPLLRYVTENGRELAAPAVLMEYTKGAFAGGRWVLINQMLDASFWNGGGDELLTELASFVSYGVTEIWLKPNYACYELGEKPILTLQFQQLGRELEEVEWKAELCLYKETADGGREELHRESVDFTAKAVTGFARRALPVEAEAGFYIVAADLKSSKGELRSMKQGFWGRDDSLLREGEMLTAGRDYFYKGGKPFPVVGMTYMTSDVARKYLHLPNASVWDRDMAQMKKAGINLIRTGIWTAVRTMGFVDGHVSEDILRAIDAFVLTSKKHGLELTFNFFAFTPELWEGLNPYLDPRSVEAQKRFISAVVSRHKDSANVHWDLINEPSMFDPKNLWSPRTLRDPFEIKAYRAWLQQRHGSIALLQEKWNMTPEELPSFEAVLPPRPEEINFNTTELGPKRGGQWLDFVLFTMDMHNRWASELRDAIRSIQPKQLVTVGQDEGLGAHRPSPLFYEEAVDYTTVHSWWLMDKLVWDGIFSKAPYKPNLIQETGIMYVETPDGRAKRSEEELRNILERKYAYAFSTGGAGAVQWIWNINFYMDNVNESHIGALRADGTEKPEADVSYDFGAFMKEIGHLFVDRKLEETVAIFPFSNDLSNRSFAGDATAKFTRTLAYRMNVPFRAMGEYHLSALAEQEKPKLIAVPSAHNLSGEALDALVSHVQVNGGVLLLTGPVSLDEYWRPVNRAGELVGATKLANVRREETLLAGGQTLPVSFGGDGITKLNKELLADEADGSFADGPSRLVERELGKGKLIWSPLPIELGETYEALEAVYGLALREAGVAPELEWLKGGNLPGVYGRKLAFKEGALYIFVSEYGMGCDVEVKDPVSGGTYSFTLEAERTVMFAADNSGSLIAVYRPDEVQVTID
jgi:hypothetical protein